MTPCFLSRASFSRRLAAGHETLEIGLSGHGSLPGGIYFSRPETQGEDTGRRWNEIRKIVMLP